jgi:hypothetical protein
MFGFYVTLCFFFYLFFLLFVMFTMFGCYIKEREREREKKWGRGVNCEEEMREKNEIGEEDVCVWWGRRKKKGRRYMGGGEKKKGNKKEKRNGEWSLRVWWEKKGS